MSQVIRQGNSHSALLESVASAKKETQKANETFAESILKHLKKTPEPSLRDILASAKGLVKTAQMEMPMGEPEMGNSMGEMGSDGIGDLPAEEPAGETGDTEAAKRSLVDALVALCGSPEAAKEAIDANGGATDPVESLPDDMGPMEEDPMAGPPAPEAQPMPMPA